MIITAILILLSSLLSDGFQPQSPQSFGAESGLVVLRNVNVLGMDDDLVRPAQSVAIRDGVILWVGRMEDDGIYLDMADSFLTYTRPVWVMPGLTEMHAHIPAAPRSQNPEEYEEQERWVHRTLAMYLVNGVTTVRGMLGEPSHLQLREQARNQQLVAPQIYTSGPSFNGNSVRTVEDGIRMVREQQQMGYDLLKFHPGLSLEIFHAVAQEARNLGMEFSGHISHGVGLQATLGSGKTTIDHLDRYMEFLSGDAALRPDPSIIYFGYDLAYHADESLIALAADKTREAGVWNVPTNTLLENVFSPDLTIEIMNSYPGMRYVPEATRSGWINFISILRNQHDYDADQARRFLELRKMLTKSLHEQGAMLLLGSDAPQIFNPPGFSLHRELQLLVDYGLTPFEAIRTGTVYTGHYLAETAHTSGEALILDVITDWHASRELAPVGVLKPGYRADIIVLDRNPLDAIPFQESIIGVGANGLFYDETALNNIYKALLQ